MSVELPLESPPVTGWRRVCRDGENWGVTLALLTMIFLPVLETLLRKTIHRGISGAPLLVQQLTFIVGMLGGAVAARDGRLLALSALTAVLHGRVRTAVTIFSQSFAAVITAFLCVASVQFVRSEIPSGDIIAYGIKTWQVELLLPVGFGVIAARLWWHAARTWRGRTVALLLIAAFVAMALWLPVSPAKLKWPCQRTKKKRGVRQFPD